MRWMTVLMGLGLTVVGTVWGGSSPPPTAFRIHMQVQGEKLPASQAMPVAIEDPPDQIYVKTLPEVSERDLTAVESRVLGGQPGLYCKFNQHGMIVLNTITTQYQGQIMVVFLNGRVLYAPVVDVRIVDGQLFIPRLVPEVEIEALKRYIQKNNR